MVLARTMISMFVLVVVKWQDNLEESGHGLIKVNFSTVWKECQCPRQDMKQGPPEEKSTSISRSLYSVLYDAKNGNNSITRRIHIAQFITISYTQYLKLH
jgi:hypothetical protein